MGYSKSVKALNRVREYLDQMLASSSQIQWQEDKPHELAFRIREGINVAKQRAKDADSPNRNTFIQYAQLSAKFIVRVGVGVVVAEPRDVMLETPKEAISKQVLPGLSSDMEIVGAAIVHKTPVMFFPDATNEPGDLNVIYAWSQKHSYFLVSSEEGLTLTKTDPGEIAWNPQQQ
ncbi:MAG: hypothetical protein H0U60_19580 [Blastocatellia bacterium]|nr:hypothetical protein [Blastocatellia bacterium]